MGKKPKPRDSLSQVEQNRLNEWCADHGISRADLLIRLLREFLAKPWLTR